MSSLIGTVFNLGIIEFLRKDNQWAFARMQAESKDGTAPRVVLDPKKAPINLQVSPNVKAEDFPWVERINNLLLTADKVFLQPKETSLRFMQCVHDFSKNKQLITLGSQSDVNDFARKHWGNIRYLFASRHLGFRFNINTMVSHRRGDDPKSTRIELKARLLSDEDSPRPHVVFDGTGSQAAMQIVEWRNTTSESGLNRFSPEDSRIELIVGTVKQPLSFVHEYREEFRNHAFMFEGEKFESNMKKIAKRSVETETLD